MRLAPIASIATFTAAAMAMTGAATAQDLSDGDVIFDNAIDPAEAEAIVEAADNQTLVEGLFISWMLSRQMYRDALEAGTEGAEITALEAAAEAAGNAYEAALIAQNTVQLASAEPTPLSDDMVAEMFVPTAE